LESVDVDGTTYSFLIGGDGDRNGAYIEVSAGEADVVAELFCPYGKDAMLLTLWREYLPLEVVEEAVRIARREELVGR
jgi:hypothetical protein